MSAFFLSVNRDGSAFAPSQAQSMMKQLDRFGRDSKQLLVHDNYALGYQSLWTVPSEQGEQQPLRNQRTGDYMMFSGRIDNRDTLINLLQLNDPQLSDAQLLMSFYQRYKTRLHSKLKIIVGPFVFVIFNPQKNQVIAARDAMGGRYLCYRITEQHIHIASYEMAIVAHDSVDYAINKRKAAKALSVDTNLQPCSAIVGIEPILPGHCLSLLAGQHSNGVFYLPDPKKRIHLRNDEQYALEFRRLLDQAVARRLPSVGGVGSMLSGGLDSVPMSISACERLQKTQESLTAFSWVFDKFPESDEREYSSDVCKRFGIDQVCINCDEVWPQFNEGMHINPIVPFGIPYSEFQQSIMRAAMQRNVSTLLTGIYGDHLYQHTNTVFLELLSRGRLRQFTQEFKRFWNEAPSKTEFLKFYFVAHLPGVRRLQKWRQNRRKKTSDLLVDELLDEMSDEADSHSNPESHYLASYSKEALRPEQYQSILDAAIGEDAASGKYMEAKFNLERRYPFRDRELCEFMLAIPSDQLYFNLSLRPILKRAYQSDLGDMLLNRNTKTSFLPVINAGITADHRCEKWFEQKPQAWRAYVKESYFKAESAPKSMLNIVRWRCGFYNYWKSTCYSVIAKQLGKAQK